MILYIILGFLLGVTVPCVASRFGKVLPADPGTVAYHLPHRPRFPKNDASHRREKLWRKWEKMAVFSAIWGIVLSILSVSAYAFIGASYAPWILCFLYLVALCMTVDQQFFLIPDFFTLPLLLVGIGCAYFSGLLTVGDALCGAAFGYFVSVVSVIIMNFFRSAVFGAGDVKMITALGAFLGLAGINYVLFLSFVIFALWGVVRQKKIGPFGPALGIAGVFVLFYLYAR